MKKAVLLDVSAIMYRAYFANMNFRTKNEPTGAVYGFTNTLLSIIKEFSPDYIGAAFDVKRASLKRSEIYSEYKAQRDAVPEDLLLQIPRIEEVLDGFNINRFKIDGYEADDVMGTLSQKLSNEGIEVIVVTGDKDLAQILDKNVKIALLGKGEGGDKFKILETDEDVVEYLGVTSKMIPDFFGLIGDSSDGIPGVRKIGPKKAVPMLEKYGNLEGVYENIDKLTEIPGIGKSLIINMKEDKEIAFISRKLATIEKDIPLECKIDDLKYSIDNKKLLDLFKTLEFRVLVKKMGLESPALSVEEKAPEPTSLQMGLFSTPSVQENESVEPVAKQRNFTVVDDEEKFKQFSDKLAGEKRLAFFYSGTGFAVSSLKDDFYIPLGHTPLFHKNLDLDKVKEFFRNSDSIFITYNFKPLLNEGIKIKNMDMDLMIAYHLISSQTKEGVEIPLEQLSGIDIAPYSEKFGKEAPGNLSTEEYGKFLVERSKGIMETYGIAMEEIKGKNLLEVLKETEMPLIKVLSAMERKGIKIDPVYFAKYEKELEILLNNLQKKIFEIAGEEFNLNSPKQLAEVLFFKLNLDPVKKTKTGLSTDEEVLEKLKNDGVEIASYILEYRKYAKLKNTYVDALPKLADSRDRLHTTFNQIGTTTGRLSSSNPNLQNIPVKTDEGMKIRQGFIADNGNVLMGIDYSQIELRVLAELSKDENLIAAYKNNEDLHRVTAKKIFELEDGEEVSREQRIIAKTINFSIIYGKTAFGLSKELGITQKEATDYINRYFEQYPKVKDFEKSIIAYAEKNGYTETYFGRRRIIEGILSKNKNIKNQAERMAVNSVIQGTAAEILKKVMIEIFKVIENKEDISLLLQVHDELIFEIKEEKVEEYRTTIENIMRNSVKFDDVVLDINTNIGKNWAETK
ncbi:MAG: DNA polymerase I [Fusobacterium varium]|jgi:DNA polymerase-1|uniref:DNA polymerase I n=1 Tax=Fusobacterium TaxID=848 RepID=UPI0008A47163|nr:MULTISPECIES: DNA polymerase I [Fusobacterium]MCF2673687.1 DNA polymerase I [Fusobacterium varium]OFL78901.1 DNA polymerase I [Fusobacterium sp. HMSC073F01]RHG36327.1 DNA polymerase I [Fusobacterium varium]HBJ77667.1 DNA polymerase I [Fusobacterium sp.]